MLSFSNPLFLLGLTALAAPVVLHLMNREMPRPLNFSSIRFITRAQLPRKGHRELRDIILFVLRVLFLIATILAFSRPKWRKAGKSAVASRGKDGNTVMLADVSASMMGWNGIVELRRLMKKTVREQPEGTVGIVVSSNRPVITMEPGTGRRELMKAIDALQAENVAGDHGDGLRTAVRMLEPGRDRELVIVSDFQRSDWQLPEEGIVPDAIPIRLMDVNPDRAGNVGISGVTVQPISAEKVRAVVEIQNFSDIQTDRNVEMTVGGEIRSETVALPPRHIRKVPFAVPREKVTRAKIVLEPDTYPGDDTYHFWLGALPPVQLLAVVPLEHEPRKENELFFLRKALGVPDRTHRAGFRLETVGPDSFFALNLDNVDAVFLLGAAGYFHEVEFRMLRSFLERGGTVILTPGEMISHQFYGLRRHGLLDAELMTIAGEREAGGGGFGLGSVNADGMLGEIFAQAEQTDLFRFPIRRYVRFRSDGDMQIVLSMLNGDPALVEATVGNGRLFVSMFGFGPWWSDLPMTGVFLPLIRELLGSTGPGEDTPVRLCCGEPIPVIRDLLGQELVSEERESTLDTSLPGVFSVGETPFEINISRSESVVGKANLLDLKLQLTGGNLGGPRKIFSESGPGLPGEANPGLIRLWPYLAAAAALLLIAELAVAVTLDRREYRPG